MLDARHVHPQWEPARIHRWLTRTFPDFCMSRQHVYRVLERGTAAITGHGSGYKCEPYRDRIVELLRGNPDDETKERDGTRTNRHHVRAVIAIISEEEKSDGPVFSLTALHNFLKHIELNWRLRRRGPAVTANNRLQRIVWWRGHRRWTLADWRRMVFTDSVALSPDYASNRHNEGLWGFHDDPVPSTQRRRRAASVLHCYGALTRYGLVGPFFITGSINGVTYRRKILKPMLAAVAALFAANHDAGNFIWQQDGAAAHKDRRTQEYLAEHAPAFVGFRDWPGNSPDLSPIEQVWPRLSEHCAPYGSFGVPHDVLQEKAVDFYRDLPQQMCLKLLHSNKKRMSLLPKCDYWSIPQ